MTDAAIHTAHVTSNSPSGFAKASPAPRQPPECRGGQRQRSQPDDLDQQEEAERVEHPGPELARAAGSCCRRMSIYERVADLPLTIDDYALEDSPCRAASNA